MSVKLNGVRVHPSITATRISKMIEDQEPTHPGLCILCGEEHDECEPDAEKYHCSWCGTDNVYGAEQLLLSVA